MSSIYTDIRAALETRLNTTSNIPVVAWENVDYSPTTGTPFIKCRFLPTSRIPATRGPTPFQRYQGIFQMLVHYPEDTGPGATQTTVDTLVERFESTTDISYNSIVVTLDYTQQESSYSNPPWFVTPITVGWYIYNV